MTVILGSGCVQLARNTPMILLAVRADDVAIATFTSVTGYMLPDDASSCLVLWLAAYRGLHHDDTGATILGRTKPGLARSGRLGADGTWEFLWSVSVSVVSNDAAELWVAICDAASTGAWFFFLADPDG